MSKHKKPEDTTIVITGWQHRYYSQLLTDLRLEIEKGKEGLHGVLEADRKIALQKALLFLDELISEMEYHGKEYDCTNFN